MKWTQIPLGLVQANCYLLENEYNEAVIIDPGGEGERLISLVENKSLNPKAILLTHAHFDHIAAVDVLRREWSIPVYLHHAEQEWLADPAKNASATLPEVYETIISPADEIIEEEGILKVDSFSFEVIETPGHSPGSVSFYNQRESVVFSGDALFSGSIGRTDLYGGNHEQLMSSIAEKLLVLPDDVVVASGHGPETTIVREKQTNPFL